MVHKVDNWPKHVKKPVLNEELTAYDKAKSGSMSGLQEEYQRAQIALLIEILEELRFSNNKPEEHPVM